MGVKRKLLLDQCGGVFVAASKMHHVEQYGRELEPHCGVVDGIQLRREELDRRAAASATLQLFKKTQRLGTNIPGFDRVFEILARFIDSELGEGLGRKKRQGFVRRDLWQP